MRVFFHTRTKGKADWYNEKREFDQLPRVGEYVALASDDEDYHKVEMVIHCPFDVDVVAEVYATRVNHMVAKRAEFGGTEPLPRPDRSRVRTVRPAGS